MGTPRNVADVKMTSLDANIAKLIELQDGSFVHIMKKAVREDWPQRKLARHLTEEWDVTISQFGARQMLARWRAEENGTPE